MELSKTMTEVISMMKEHGDLRRYDGGFWSWNDVELIPVTNGGNVIGMRPIWNCGIKTLRGLEKRNLVILDEENKICKLK